MQLKSGIEPPTFQLVDDLVCLLNHSHLILIFISTLNIMLTHSGKMANIPVPVNQRDRTSSWMRMKNKGQFWENVSAVNLENYIIA